MRHSPVSDIPQYVHGRQNLSPTNTFQTGHIIRALLIALRLCDISSPELAIWSECWWYSILMGQTDNVGSGCRK